MSRYGHCILGSTLTNFARHFAQNTCPQGVTTGVAANAIAKLDAPRQVSFSDLQGCFRGHESEFETRGLQITVARLGADALARCALQRALLARIRKDPEIA